MSDLIQTLKHPLLCGLVSAVFTLGAGAETQYWVSIGSFENEDNAQRQQRAASAVLPGSQVVFASTDRGSVYRVVQGPFFSRSNAESELVSAIAAGYGDAWLLAKNDTDELGLSSFPTSDTYEALDTDQPDYVPSYASRSITDFGAQANYEGGGTDAASEFGAPRPAREPATELVTEAPPGYNLHRLIRSVGRAPE